MKAFLSRSSLIAAGLLSVVTIQSVNAEVSLSVLASFNGTNGKLPNKSLTLDPTGNLYGTTFSGGAAGDVGLGTVFKIASAGTEEPAGIETIFRFGSDTLGADPAAGLLLDAAGNLYGSTYYDTVRQRGTIFKIASETSAAPRTLTTLHHFDNVANGYAPTQRLIADSAGNLYGAAGGGPGNRGIIFKIPGGTTNTPGALVTLASFDGSNGSYPLSGLLLDSSGFLYGTTLSGGTDASGTVYKVPTTAPYSVSTIAHFDMTNGSSPRSELISDADGNLFGTTSYGGFADSGTIFKIPRGTSSTPGELVTIATFDGTDSGEPMSGVIADLAGNLYGTARSGGVYNLGAIYKVTNGANTSSGALITTLASFDGTNGANPEGSLVADANGNLFASARYGGTDNAGTVVKISGAGFITRHGDTDGDQRVDFSDLLALAQHYGIQSQASWADGDFDHDGAVLFADLLILAQNYNVQTNGAGSNSAGDFAADWTLARSMVPEPTSLGVAGVAGALLARRRT